MMGKENKKISLLDRWKNKSKQKPFSNQIHKAPKDAVIPLSPGQKRLWFLQQMYPKNPFYNYSETYTFSGKLNLEHLISSLQKVYKDHDIFRTYYHISENNIIQKIDKNVDIDIKIHDLSTFKETEVSRKCKSLMKDEATRYFDLAKAPIIRASIIKLSEEKHILQISLHHIATDKKSMVIFRKHLSKYYQEISLNREITNKRTPLQYADYCYWLQQKEIDRKALDYWKKQLIVPIPQLTLPYDYDRPLQPSFKGSVSSAQKYSPQLSEQLLSLSKQLETTPYNLMLSVFFVFLNKCSGQNDILVGSPITDRDQKAIEDIIGFFINTVVIRNEIKEKMTFTDLVKAIHQKSLEAFDNKNVAFDLLVKEMNIKRSLSINPFFNTMFLYYSVDNEKTFSNKIDIAVDIIDSKVSKFDLTIYVAEENGILSSTFEYALDLFEETTINRFQEYFKILLENIVSNPFQNISDLQILTASEKELFIKQENSKENLYTNKGIHDIIEEIALKKPNKKAVSFKDEFLSYSELNTKANALAYHILKHGVEENSVIGLCCERSTDMIVGLLGILKAGCSYLPIDPEYPKERIDFVLNDSNAKIIVTQSFLSDRFKKSDFSCITIDNFDTNSNSEANLPQVKETDLAYIIYTSGSTGKPKGVPISHKNIINSTMGRLDFYDNNPDAFLLMSSIAFDSSKAGIFWTLCTGGNLVITEKRIEQDIDKIGTIINNLGITHTLMLPSLYNLILDYVDKDKLQSLTTVIVAGEACTVSLCEKHLENLQKVNLYNEYGPTEASVWCIAHKIDAKDLKLKSIPIGKPVANATVYILDKTMNFTPFGVSGDIYIGGPGLSEGYINRNDLTEKVFLKNPHKANDSLYRTGDLGMYKSDGAIQFLGRADQQIKIRGFRVELSEIENVIKQYNQNITDVVVLAEEESNYTDFEIDNISKEHLATLLENFDENELNELFNSIKLLSTKEKNYLLNQI